MKGDGGVLAVINSSVGSAEVPSVPLGPSGISCFHSSAKASDEVVPFSILRVQVTVDHVQNWVRGRSYIPLSD